ncbi:hypothetical protein [Eubacterium ventriosum]|jgi:hypothetical protein|uniref:Uncharacterized protein n=1 Tax=Eubacterium ventriosum ATCC 27560 TaxID=411463 RepID=A5Z403_9FIRM|nr:hypothetical protein [Eubacterium ventriosum]EDM52213.1 hypothetical protein EUBVEN_00409 [Eubacterium ventriosum ATCC 27560]UWP35796.1 hypothetical protein NQ558_11935 [Eubacterium ventriosum]
MKKQHIIIIAVIVVFWIGHGIIASNNRQTENTTTENQTDVRGGTAELEKTEVPESEKQEETTEQKETTEAITEEPTEIVEHRTGDNIVGISDKDITTIYSTKYDTVRNDVTGNWKCIVIAENNFNVEDYALSCYKNYFDSDKTILAVENLTTKTSTSISVVSGLLYVSVYEYTKGEEHDAKAMFGGTHLVDYIVYTDNGDIEKVTDSE